MHDAAHTLRDLYLRNAARHADRIALRCDDATRTHAALADRGARLANALRAEGLGRGDRVAVLSANATEVIEVFAATALVGAIAVPINFRLTSREIAWILEDCAPRIVICDAEHAATLARAIEARPASERPHVITIGAEYESVLARSTNAVPQAAIDPRDTAFIIYTSGSTGRPKGVMLSHGGQVEAARQLALCASVRPDCTLLVAMPLFHVGAVNQASAYLWLGASVLIHRKFDPARLLADVATYRVTGLHLAPVMVKSVLEQLEQTPADVTSLRSIKYASSPMPLPTLTRAIERFGPILVQYYGLTETGGLVSALLPHEHRFAPDGSAPTWLRSGGKPHPVCAVRIERADGSPCAIDEAGEIVVRATSLMTGYWRNEAATREALRDGWFATGDVGYVDAAGYVYVIDRKKDMIISGGENIASREVEEALLTHPAVAEAAVIGVPDARWGEAVKAFVVLHVPATPAALIEHCKTRIASYKKPQSIEVCDALPRASGTGKIDKRALRESAKAASA